MQEVLESALAQILRRPARLTVAGRTDAGVHARGQVAHVDIASTAWSDLGASLLRRLNAVLADDVRVLGLAKAASGFDARFSALWRSYEYRVTDASYGADPLERRLTAAWPRPLSAGAMSAAAALLVGEHDFAAFCRYRPNTTTVRGLQVLAVQRRDALVTITARADAFCYSMVRSLVGALVAVGDGRRAVDWPAALLSQTSRSSDVVVAPARGLTLVAVGYPPDEELAARTLITRAVRAPSIGG